jgi:hypothetical protein
MMVVWGLRGRNGAGGNQNCKYRAKTHNPLQTFTAY